jgi:hypothetical protein
MKKPRLNGPNEPAISESEALRMICRIAPNIPAKQLWEAIYLGVEINRRPIHEMSPSLATAIGHKQQGGRAKYKQGKMLHTRSGNL